MTSLTIGFEFVTGRCVAASVYDRDEPEWPPHPGRVFMAMAAACFEMGEDLAEVTALQWLEAMSAPEIYASDYRARSQVEYYVPVNDKLTVNTASLQSVPGLSRSKQERGFPTAIPFDPIIKLVWPDAPHAELHFQALSRICANVVRIGHSSSMVRGWAELLRPIPAEERRHQRWHWQPTTTASRWQARMAGAGEFDRLRRACQAERIDQFCELTMQIESTKGRAQKEAKEVFQSLFGEPYKSSLRAPEPTPPTLGLWQGYRTTDHEPDLAAPVAGEHFDSQLLVLTKMEGATIGIRDCLALTSRLRDAAMAHCPASPPPAWLGGHEPATGKATELPHTAFLALPFVGRKHADGHIMGLALAMPRRIPGEERGPVLAPLLLDKDGNARDVELRLGKLGTWTLRLEERAEPPRTLLNSTWTRASHAWASVTPVVLDRFPKASRRENRRQWEAEVRQIITSSCRLSGLPEPLEVDLDTTSWHIGIPRAFAKSHPLRGSTFDDRQHKSVGDGFPAMPSRPGKPARPQIHVYLRFAVPVIGPILLGAGRYFGYGMCKPIE